MFTMKSRCILHFFWNVYFYLCEYDGESLRLLLFSLLDEKMGSMKSRMGYYAKKLAP